MLELCGNSACSDPQFNSLEWDLGRDGSYGDRMMTCMSHSVQDWSTYIVHVHLTLSFTYSTQINMCTAHTINKLGKQMFTVSNKHKQRTLIHVHTCTCICVCTYMYIVCSEHMYMYILHVCMCTHTCTWKYKCIAHYIAKVVAEEEKERRESRPNKLHP